MRECSMLCGDPTQPARPSRPLAYRCSALLDAETQVLIDLANFKRSIEERFGFPPGVAGAQALSKSSVRAHPSGTAGSPGKTTPRSRWYALA